MSYQHWEEKKVEKKIKALPFGNTFIFFHIFVLHKNKYIMIQLFSYEDSPIRAIYEKGNALFSAQDVFKALGLTWKGTNSLRQRGIPQRWIFKKPSQTTGGLQEMTFITEQAVYMIAFSSQKNERTLKFSIWVADLLKRMSDIIRAGNIDDLKMFTDVRIQKQLSKEINAINTEGGERDSAIIYNTKNCIYHTGTTPKKIKEKAKEMGLKSTQRSSAKEAIRSMDFPVACSMSMTDKLVSRDGIGHKQAANTCKEFATPLFRELMRIGLPKEEIEKLA